MMCSAVVIFPVISKTHAMYLWDLLYMLLSYTTLETIAVDEVPCWGILVWLLIYSTGNIFIVLIKTMVWKLLVLLFKKYKHACGVQSMSTVCFYLKTNFMYYKFKSIHVIQWRNHVCTTCLTYNVNQIQSSVCVFLSKEKMCCVFAPPCILCCCGSLRLVKLFTHWPTANKPTWGDHG